MHYKYAIIIGIGLLFTCWSSAFADEAQQLVAEDELENLYQCPERGKYSCGYTGKIMKETCSASMVEELGRINGKEIVFGQYERSVDFDWSTPKDSKPNIYMCKGSDSYVFELSESGGKSVIWHKFSETSAGMSFVDSVEIYLVGDNTVLTVKMCLDGTGGCYGEHYIQVNGSWLALEKDESWAEVYDKMPKSYRQHKSRAINFDNLTWEQSIAKSTDPNCCPTGMIKFQLSIKENKLHVESYKFIFEEAP